MFHLTDTFCDLQKRRRQLIKNTSVFFPWRMCRTAAKPSLIHIKTKAASLSETASAFLTGDYLSSQAVSSQVLSAYVSLTAVFGMRTGGSPQLSPPDYRLSIKHQPSSCHFLNSLWFEGMFPQNCTEGFFFKSSPRPISTSQLNPLPDLHIWPIYLIFFKGPYQLAL